MVKIIVFGILIALTGCSMVENSTVDKELLAKLTENDKSKEHTNFKGVRPTLNYSPTITKNIYADGATTVNGRGSIADENIESLESIIHQLSSDKIKAFNERDIALQAKLETEKEMQVTIQEKQSVEKKSGLYLIFYGIGLLIIVGAFSAFLLVLRYQLGVRTTALGEMTSRIAHLERKKAKWSDRTRAGLKRIGEQINTIDQEVASNGISDDAKARLNHFRAFLRDSRDVFLGRSLLEE